MLKARKRITKKEIKRDPFLETASKAKEYVEDNQKMITPVGIGVAAQMLGLRAAGIGFSIAVAVLAAAALAGLIIRRRASD